jgi:hypothetical protein
MEITTSDGHWIDYVPDWEFGGVENRSLPEDQQVVVVIHGLSFEEQQKYTELLRMEQKGRKGFKLNTAAVAKKQFLDNVKEVRNLIKNGEAITTPEQLLKSGLNKLIEDVQEAIQDLSRLSEGDQKNLNS